MENIIKVGLGIVIRDGNKILLGHRCDNYKDTGGIYEPGSWTIPGGKQEYNETMIEGGVRIDIWTNFMRECIINYVH